MSLIFQTNKERAEIEISGTECVLPLLFEKKIFVVDTCILFPTILPRKRRNIRTIVDYDEKINKLIKIFNESKKSISYLRSGVRKRRRRQIEVVDLLEDGKFKDRGIYFGITDSILEELITLEGTFEKKNLGRCITDVENYIYKIFLDVPHLREKYRPISKMFKANGDFSLAMASYLLGCDIATDDYTCFNESTMKKLKEIYNERWGSGRELKRHDSVSLLMLLNKL